MSCCRPRQMCSLADVTPSKAMLKALYTQESEKAACEKTKTVMEEIPNTKLNWEICRTRVVAASREVALLCAVFETRKDNKKYMNL